MNKLCECLGAKCIKDGEVIKFPSYDNGSGESIFTVYKWFPGEGLLLSMSLQMQRKVNYFDEAVIFSILDSFKLL
jgi:hypothetical protein